MTAQDRSARYVCLGCGSEGLVHGDQAGGGRARCPHCGRAIELEPELAAETVPDATSRLAPAG